MDRSDLSGHSESSSASSEPQHEAALDHLSAEQLVSEYNFACRNLLATISSGVAQGLLPPTARTAMLEQAAAFKQRVFGAASYLCAECNEPVAESARVLLSCGHLMHRNCMSGPGPCSGCLAFRD